MRKCSYCGLENSDEAQECVTCHTALIPAAISPKVAETSAAERLFWDRLTLKDFAILIVKVQALWVLFPVLVDLTYLPGYLSAFFPARRFDFIPQEMKQTFYLAILRIVLRAMVGIGVFVNAEILLNWVARTLISRRGRPA